MAEETDEPFRLPMAADWDELVRNLKLSQAQAHALDIVLRHAFADLRQPAAFIVSREDRTDRIAGLEEVSGALNRLEKVFAKQGNAMDQFLPLATLHALGEMLSAQEIEQALAVQISTPSLADFIAAPRGSGEPVRASHIDAQFVYDRQTQALNRGAELLRHVIRRINGPIQAWRELNRKNRGGRPINRARDHLISELARHASQIIGTKASSTANGRFVNLCIQVFIACNIDDTGLENAVEQTLKRLRSDRRAELTAKPAQK